MGRFKQFFLEGGHAVKNVIPIEQELIPKTMESFQKKVLNKLGLNKQKEDWELIGSAGKKDRPSGDLDIAVNVLKIMYNNDLNDFEDVKPFIISKLDKLGYEYTFSKGLSIFSIQFPISGEYDKFVQIDLMLTDNMDFTVWSHWSPKQTETKFKKMGVYRNALIIAIASVIDKKIISKFDDGEAKELEKTYFDFAKGFGRKVINHLSKTGKKLKNGKVISRKIETSVPTEIVKILLGENATIQDTNSFESIYDKIYSGDFPYKNKRKDIMKKAKDFLSSNNLPIPEELE